MARKMTRWSQFVAMGMGQLAGGVSLRDIVSNLSAQSRKLYDLGVGEVSRSSLARVNAEKPWELYRALFGRLLSRCRSAAPGHRFRFKEPAVLAGLDGDRPVPVGVSVGEVPADEGRGEGACAAWREMDLEAATWTVPAERMKARREHRVPLSPRCVAILREAKAMPRDERTADSPLVFPSHTGGVLSAPTIGLLLKEHGVDTTVHGFRSTFRDWAAEQTRLTR